MPAIWSSAEAAAAACRRVSSSTARIRDGRPSVFSPGLLSARALRPGPWDTPQKFSTPRVEEEDRFLPSKMFAFYLLFYPPSSFCSHLHSFACCVGRSCGCSQRQAPSKPVYVIPTLKQSMTKQKEKIPNYIMYRPASWRGIEPSQD